MTSKERMKLIYSSIPLLFALILVSLSLFREDTSKEYIERGIKVQATITSSFMDNAYYGVYKDSNGNLVEAEIIKNDFSAGIGTEVEGYYLPEKPNKVWCKPSDTLVFALNALSWVFEILLLGYFGCLIWAIIYMKKKEKEKNKEIWQRSMEEYNWESKRDNTNTWEDDGRGWYR